MYACTYGRAHSCMHVRLRARVRQVYRHIPIVLGAHVHACKPAATRMRTAVLASSVRDRGEGPARRAAACGARARDRVSALLRYLYLRCPPSWTDDYCAAERDNPALACVPLTQARIAAIGYYYGPADTCEASARARHARVLAPDARARGGVRAVSLGIGLARCSSLALPAGLSNTYVCARARALECVRA